MTGNSNEVVLSAKSITKTIGNRNIVDNLSFDIRRGEVVGLLGPNGAGKTTTIRMIVGLIRISKGDVTVHGHSIRSEFTQAISHIGGIIENPEFYPYMSGYDNLRQYQRMSEGIAESRLHEVVQLVGLQDAIHKKVRSYSLGMRQRLGIAQALLHNPTILILDEPTNGLDPAGIREMRDYLKQIAKEEGIAVLVSSHLLSEIELMCSRVVVIQEGRLVTERVMGQGQNQEGWVTVCIRVNQADAALEVIRSMQEVTVLNQLTDQPELILRLKDDSIPVMVQRLVEHKIFLYRIIEVKETLEEEFLKWTGGGRIA
ncbi:ABC transporter ATP-binding protein [Paenibacillus sp. F411]|uniref:ABC transporter ATP-binding protein n=1 Tax=Paenibacillus sp. F411 TaxID=2820239 RepID=UPI001AAEE642|nr:ABC transporter ATP-binding protein [Paenibacillus sp. F411]MBO2945858.1 ABC transporter ATP-binding protein [Paenibacillus sp. F411]